MVRELDKEDLALLIQFVTGTSKVPLDGFKALQVCPQTSAFHLLARFVCESAIPKDLNLRGKPRILFDAFHDWESITALWRHAYKLPRLSLHLWPFA